jgi:ATP-dependent exoDNAse (exonuclease V) beta subunit
VDPEGSRARRAVRVEGDEPAGPGARDRAAVARAALGRAVHALLEHWHPGAVPDVEGALATELGTGVPAGAREAVEAMLERFSRSAVAGRLGSALAAGDDVRRELPFHARIRFPGGARVEPFDALLVKGSIDLWLPEDGEVRLVDYKTNARTREHASPESLGEHYAWQLRLYALAAERLLGRDVRGASLLLLDPGWGPEAVEVPVDVSGPALEEARRLCQAFARAARDDRWPMDWHDLLRV